MVLLDAEGIAKEMNSRNLVQDPETVKQMAES